MDVKFRAWLDDYVNDYKLEPESVITSDLTISFTRAAKFDPAYNEGFLTESHHKHPRNAYCVDCGSQLVMSGWLYDTYNQMEIKPIVVCEDCLTSLSLQATTDA